MGWGGEAFAWRVFCKCQELRVDGFINPLSLQNTWRRREEGGGRKIIQGQGEEGKGEEERSQREKRKRGRERSPKREKVKYELWREGGEEKT